jgi:hypothetical protein
MTNEERIRAVLDFYLEKGINKESVNRVYFKILKCKKHLS